MNYPIQGDQLTVEMLQGLYPFGGYDTFYRFIHDLNQYDVFDNEADLNEYFIGWLEFDMQNRDDDEHNIHPLSDDIQNQANITTMNYPIQTDQLTVGMLRGVYQFDDETLYQRLIDEYGDIIYETEEDLIDMMQVFEDLNNEDGYDDDDEDEEEYEGINWETFDLQYLNPDNYPKDHHRWTFKYLILNQATMFKQRRIFKYTIHQDLIAAAMHPNRIQKQLEQFDDIEAYFDAIGC
jgi:hypothetical protein